MRIHIVGSGPTGMSIAWELLKSEEHEVIIYDRKKHAGGSWWEPEGNKRDIHAHRIVFGNAFKNTSDLFNQMGISWNEMFELVDSRVYTTILKYLNPKDYAALSSLAVRVLSNQNKYKSITLKDAMGELSETGKSAISTLTLIMDGVTWDVMSAYEFVKSFDHVGLSRQYTQRVSGKIMSDKMQKELVKKGAIFKFNAELTNVEYGKDEYVGIFEDGSRINDGMLIMAIDNGKAINLVKNNWGEDIQKKIGPSTYGCINVLFDYEEEIYLEKTDLEYAMETEFKIQPVVLSDRKTVSCVICDLTEEILTTDPETLKTKVFEQLNVPKPMNVRIGWGCNWENGKWVSEQSSGVLSLHGQVPFYGKCSKVALCGMMSERKTPYSSIEAAIEVGRQFCSENFNTKRPLKTLLVTDLLLFILIVLILTLIYKKTK